MSGYYVKRTRIRDRSQAHALGRPSEVGKVGYSRTFPTRRAAEREAAAWREAEDWEAVVLEGRAPRKRQS